MNRSITPGFLLLALLGVAADRAGAADRPNVLFLISDDLNNALGCYGNPLMETPNIDRLAARGVRFDRAYCQYPLCGPSRNSMLTGLYPNSTGILANSQIFRQTIPSAVSLPQAFRLDGYFAGRIGKLYHYNVPNSIGTNGHDDPGSWELELNPAGVDRLVEQPDEIFSLVPGQFGGTLSWYASPRPEEQHTDALQAVDAEWVLERCARRPDRPFFLAVGFFRPHTPYVAPESYFGRYPKERMPVVEGVEEDQRDIPPPGLMSSKKEQDALTDDLRREALQAYYASISFMDAQVGKVLDALDRLGLAEDTIIVMTSDHGYHTGEHGLWQKMSLFEESARVPLIIAAPGVSRGGTVSEAPVGLVDLYPTLAELCGVDAPDGLQGQSLVPLLKDPEAPGRGWALSQVRRGGGQGGFLGYSLRTPRWRYTEWDGGDRGRELYDHDADPRELTNLADDHGHADAVAELSALLREAVGSTFPPSGETPELRDGPWAPNLTNP
ncbi:sulfatase [Tautonia plasticadhaerens]|uniref:Choline-sulfatase n=1 Tax=Tautonia plasticadhaerens TaxID=2527974 RepID=A0A518H3F6_9BACT|nr:sulfatase [Tautonia plasticadhaerens]QDV35391.1 Choline-sulfatase [Tautonia plasticadhaerens]